MQVDADIPKQHEGPLAEFVALRAELQQRGEMQWRVMSLQITGSGAIFGFALSSSERVALLLIAPIMSYMFGARYAMHNHAIIDIAKYIRTRLSPRVPGGLGWEDWMIEKRQTESIGSFNWGNPNLLIFPGVGVLSLATLLAWPFASSKWIQQSALISTLETLAWLLGFGLTIACVRIVRRSTPYRLAARH